MKAAQILREKINGPDITTGMLCTFHYWPGMVELAMRAGLDYIIIDLEHLTHDHEAVGLGCAIGRMNDFPVLIRPPAAELTHIRLAMDLGPCGLLVPMVESLDDMATIEAGAFMPPRGRRRPGGVGNYWVSDYHHATWVEQVEQDLVILPQIESEAGLDHVDAIAAHDATTAVAIGPYDLAANLGVCWRPDDPAHRAAVSRIRAAAKKAGKNMWQIGNAADLVAQGFNFLCIAEPIMLMEGALKQLSDSVKARDAQAGAADGRKPLP